MGPLWLWRPFFRGVGKPQTTIAIIVNDNVSHVILTICMYFLKELLSKQCCHKQSVSTICYHIRMSLTMQYLVVYNAFLAKNRFQVFESGPPFPQTASGATCVGGCQTDVQTDGRTVLLRREHAPAAVQCASPVQ